MKAVILAGGPGTRMRPLTYVMPKCMLPVAGKPLLERTIEYLGSYGIREFIICVAYLKRQIISAIGDGSVLGVSVSFAEADTPLGTAGQLKTAERLVTDPFIVMNGDIITSLNIRNLVNKHLQIGGIGTVAVKKFDVRIPYGHITINESDSSIQLFEEKPTISYLANAGVYVFRPDIFRYIPHGRVCSLEREIFPDLLSKGHKINSYYEDASWADVGSMTDFEKVNDELLSTNSNLVPGVVGQE